MFTFYSKEKYLGTRKIETLPKNMFNARTMYSSIITSDDYKGLLYAIEDSKVINQYTIETKTGEIIATQSLGSGLRNIANHMMLAIGEIPRKERYSEEDYEGLLNRCINVKFCGTNIIDYLLTEPNMQKYDTIPIYASYPCFTSKTAEIKINFNNRIMTCADAWFYMVKRWEID